MMRTIRRESLRWAIYLFILYSSLGCKEVVKRRDPTGASFPIVTGEALDQKSWSLPQAWRGDPVVVLIGYVQEAQFDIDRWLIGLDMTQTRVKIFEVPTISGLVPSIISQRINEGMRSGIPRPIWSAVITVYEDAGKLEQFTGTERPRNARVLLLDREGTVRFFKDEGFSVLGLNELKATLDTIK